MKLTEEGITTAVKLHPPQNPSLISFSDVGMEIDFNDEQSANTYPRISTTEVGMKRVSKAEQP